ncbi:MAG: hypothetical protein AB8B92_09480 [Gammaproteobacteria bacterium]
MTPKFRTTGEPEKVEKFRAPPSDGVPVSITHPVFCLRHLGHDKSFSVEKLEKKFIVGFVKKLNQLATQSWAEIRGNRKQANGFELIPKDQIKGRIPDDFAYADDFTVFRFSGKKARFAGVTSDSVMHIIWVDGKLALYDH